MGQRKPAVFASGYTVKLFPSSRLNTMCHAQQPHAKPTPLHGAYLHPAGPAPCRVAGHTSRHGGHLSGQHCRLLHTPLRTTAPGRLVGSPKACLLGWGTCRRPPAVRAHARTPSPGPPWTTTSGTSAAWNGVWHLGSTASQSLPRGRVCLGQVSQGAGSTAIPTLALSWLKHPPTHTPALP